jgi:hypothetical protein
MSAYVAEINDCVERLTHTPWPYAHTETHILFYEMFYCIQIFFLAYALQV